MGSGAARLQTGTPMGCCRRMNSLLRHLPAPGLKCLLIFLLLLLVLLVPQLRNHCQVQSLEDSIEFPSKSLAFKLLIWF